jgi:hypothetical protein
MGDLPYKIPEKLKKLKIENADNVERVAMPARTYSQEEVDSILQKREQGTQNSGGGDSGEANIGINANLLKQLQNTVGVFNALKEFASNPLTRAIESKVGERAAGIVDQAFGAPQQGSGKKDLLDMVLNSQMAYGFGQGLGARGPEFVESLGKTFGKERIDKFADNMLDQYGRATPQPNSGTPNGNTGNTNGPVKESSQKDLLLTLDPNNPEHVAAYAESQGGIRVEVARKMLMIHQDDFIKQMQEQGLDVSGFNKQNEEMLRLKSEQEEMLRMKRDVDRQLNELDRNRDKVVSFKDIKGKQEVEDKVAEIPDKWGSEDLTEAEIESITKAEFSRQANIQNSTGTQVTTGVNIKAVDTVVEQHIVEPVVEPVVQEEIQNEEAKEEEKEEQIDNVVIPVIEEPKEIVTEKEVVKETKSKFQKGSQGWLKEQKEKKAAKGDV